MDRRTFLRGSAAAGVLAATPRVLFGQDQEPPGPGFQEMTAEQAAAAKRGLDYLARVQGRSGGIGQTCQVAFTSLAALAFMASGSTPTRGPYSENLRNALKFIMRCRTKKGYLNEGGGGGRAMGGSGMHGHGFALLFLAELYGMCGDLSDQVGDDSIKEAITLACRVTEGAQDPNGGWTYDPNPNGHEGSVTITQVQALRAARNVGVNVSQKVIEKGISYIKKSTASDGTIMYSLGGGGGGSYALTAAGACVYAYYGIYDGPEVGKCMKALYDFVTGKRGGGRGGHDFYAHFYAAQACFFMKRKEMKFWTDGYARIRKDLLQSQNKSSGSWSSDGYDGTFGTAVAALVLQIPNRYLPIFQD